MDAVILAVKAERLAEAARGKAGAVQQAAVIADGGVGGIAFTAPGPNDPVIQGRQNKFFNTHLHETLWVRGIRTVILCGWRANGLGMAWILCQRGHRIG